MPEREFGKIELIGKGRLKITSNQETSIIALKEDPRKVIDQDLILNLKSLAIYAQGPFDDSAGESSFNQEILALKERFPKEQPEDVWRRTLATLMADGMKISGIAEVLLGTSYQFTLSEKLGDISAERKAGELKKLKDTIRQFWPQPR